MLSSRQTSNPFSISTPSKTSQVHVQEVPLVVGQPLWIILEPLQGLENPTEARGAGVMGSFSSSVHLKTRMSGVLLCKKKATFLRQISHLSLPS